MFFCCTMKLIIAMQFLLFANILKSFTLCTRQAHFQYSLFQSVRHIRIIVCAVKKGLKKRPANYLSEKKYPYLCTRNRETLASSFKNGVLVQLVRMPPCHGGGHGFESHTHREKVPYRCLWGTCCIKTLLYPCYFLKKNRNP